MRPPPTTTRWRKVLFASGVFLLALELVLQVGAAVAAWAIARDAGPAGAAVLCIGDSHTYGIGATSAASSYPARLGELLRNRGLDVEVVSRHYARVIAPREPGKAAALLVAATLLDGGDGLARAHMRALAANVPWDEFERVMTPFGSDRAGAMATLRPLLRTLHAGDASNAWTGVLREHLEHIAGLARRHGAKVVLLSYPFFNAELEGTLREAATALAVPFVAVRERFDEELQHRSREQLFVRDGHCSDAGHAIVAALVADAVAPLLTKLPGRTGHRDLARHPQGRPRPPAGPQGADLGGGQADSWQPGGHAGAMQACTGLRSRSASRRPPPLRRAPRAS